MIGKPVPVVVLVLLVTAASGQDCVRDSIPDEIILSRAPYRETDHVRLISFSYDAAQSELPMEKRKMLEDVRLTRPQAKALFKILVNYKVKPEEADFAPTVSTSHGMASCL